jgi:hypothetical protein
MRRAEVLGLRWRDVDLDVGRLAVRQAYISIDGRPQFSEPKTRQSRRTIDVDARTVEVLRDWAAKQDAERQAWSDAWNDHGLVVTQEDGSPVLPDRFSKDFQRHATAAGLPGDPPARPAAHPRQPAAGLRRQPQGRLRAARPPLGGVHPRRLQPRRARDAVRSRRTHRRDDLRQRRAEARRPTTCERDVSEGAADMRPITPRTHETPGQRGSRVARWEGFEPPAA